MTIINVRLGINEVAHAAAVQGEPLPCQALTQTLITGFERPDGSRYDALPDVIVYCQAVNQDRGSLSVALDGPPVLILEVASESTYASDLDLVRGKAFSYARAGVKEYLVLDPTGIFLAEFGRGWRLLNGVYQPWRQDAQGRWQSQEFPLAFAVDNWLASVHESQTGRRLLHEGEITAALAQKDAEVAELRRRLEERDQS
jgi:Uma2 family endonuclease